MSEINYSHNGVKYSTTGKCWGMAPKSGVVAFDSDAVRTPSPRPKSSRERRAAKKGK